MDSVFLAQKKDVDDRISAMDITNMNSIRKILQKKVI